MFRIRDIKRELEGFTGLTFVDSTWTRWRKIAGIQPRIHKCNEQQWKALCACVAIHIDGQKVDKSKVVKFLSKNPDPKIFLPDYIPHSFVNQRKVRFTGSCLGKDLADEVAARTGFKPSKRTLSRYLSKVLNLKLLDDRRYSDAEIKQICAYRTQIHWERRKRGFALKELRRNQKTRIA